MSKNVIIAVVAGVLLVAAVAVVLVLTLGRDPGVGPGPDRTATPTSTAPTSTSATPSETQALSPDEQFLLSIVPTDFVDCEAAEPFGDGDLAAVRCGASSTRPGPQSAEFFLYDDVSTLEAAFAGDVAAQGVAAMPEGADCTTSQGVHEWQQEGSPGGQVACVVVGGEVVVGWTDREHRAMGVVRGPGSTQDDLAVLVQWWRHNSDFAW